MYIEKIQEREKWDEIMALLAPEAMKKKKYVCSMYICIGIPDMLLSSLVE
jgi:hypothetical protein